MAGSSKLPDLSALNNVVIGLALGELERRWHIASLAIDAGAEPAGIDDDTLVWWREAYRTYLVEPGDPDRGRRRAPAAAPPTVDRAHCAPAA